MKKCKKCGVPLEGLMYKIFASPLLGVKPSEKDPDTCNKCTDQPKKSCCSCCK